MLTCSCCPEASHTDGVIVEELQREDLPVDLMALAEVSKARQVLSSSSHASGFTRSEKASKSRGGSIWDSGLLPDKASADLEFGQAVSGPMKSTWKPDQQVRWGDQRAPAERKGSKGTGLPQDTCHAGTSMTRVREAQHMVEDLEVSGANEAVPAKQADCRRGEATIAAMNTTWKPWLPEVVAPEATLEDISLAYEDTDEFGGLERCSGDCSPCVGLSGGWKPKFSTKRKPALLGGIEDMPVADHLASDTASERDETELGEPCNGPVQSTASKMSKVSNGTLLSFGDPCIGPLHSTQNLKASEKKQPRNSSRSAPRAADSELGVPVTGPTQSTSQPQPQLPGSTAAADAEAEQDSGLGAPVAGPSRSTASVRSVRSAAQRPKEDIALGQPVTGVVWSTASAQSQQGQAPAKQQTPQDEFDMGQPVTGTLKSTASTRSLQATAPKQGSAEEFGLGEPVTGPSRSTASVRSARGQAQGAGAQAAPEGLGEPVTGPSLSAGRRSQAAPEPDDDFGAPVTGPSKSTWAPAQSARPGTQAEASSVAPLATARRHEPSTPRELQFGGPCAGPLRSVCPPTTAAPQAASQQPQADDAEASVAAGSGRRSRLPSGLFSRRQRSSSPGSPGAGGQAAPRKGSGHFTWRPRSLPPPAAGTSQA